MVDKHSLDFHVTFISDLSLAVRPFMRENKPPSDYPSVLTLQQADGSAAAKYRGKGGRKMQRSGRCDFRRDNIEFACKKVR